MQGGGNAEQSESGRGHRPMLAGVEVREDDLEPARGLHLSGRVVHVSAVVILVLALGQFAAWWLDRPPGGAGLGLLVGDTIRLIVLSALLWAAGDLIELFIKTHYDLRASRILLVRQTHMMREMGRTSGELPPEPPVGERRAEERDESVVD